MPRTTTLAARNLQPGDRILLDRDLYEEGILDPRPMIDSVVAIVAEVTVEPHRFAPEQARIVALVEDGPITGTVYAGMPVSATRR